MVRELLITEGLTGSVGESRSDKKPLIQECFDVWIHLFIFISSIDKITSGCIVKRVKTV